MSMLEKSPDESQLVKIQKDMQETLTAHRDNQNFVVRYFGAYKKMFGDKMDEKIIESISRKAQITADAYEKIRTMKRSYVLSTDDVVKQELEVIKEQRQADIEKAKAQQVESKGDIKDKIDREEGVKYYRNSVRQGYDQSLIEEQTYRTYDQAKKLQTEYMAKKKDLLNNPDLSEPEKTRMLESFQKIFLDALDELAEG